MMPTSKENVPVQDLMKRAKLLVVHIGHIDVAFLLAVKSSN
jgi:hypothetical protein